MIFQILIGKSYLLDKDKKEIHDLSRRRFAKCKQIIKKIKYKNREYLKLHEALIRAEEGNANGCELCMPGIHTKNGTSNNTKNGTS